MGGVWLKYSGKAGVVTASGPPPPYEQLSPLPTHCFKMFWKDPIITPRLPLPTSSIFHRYPPPSSSTTPSPIKILNIHVCYCLLVNIYRLLCPWVFRYSKALRGTSFKMNWRMSYLTDDLDLNKQRLDNLITLLRFFLTKLDLNQFSYAGFGSVIL